jgi:hypothetical protein
MIALLLGYEVRHPCVRRRYLFSDMNNGTFQPGLRMWWTVSPRFSDIRSHTDEINVDSPYEANQLPKGLEDCYY